MPRSQSIVPAKPREYGADVDLAERCGSAGRYFPGHLMLCSLPLAGISRSLGWTLRMEAQPAGSNEAREAWERAEAQATEFAAPTSPKLAAAGGMPRGGRRVAHDALGARVRS
jgi:hypothetical protein